MSQELDIEEIIRRTAHLPASQIAKEVNQTLDTHSSLVVTAPPGAGKSTLLPLTIMMGMAGKGKILMLEPRRLAAKQIAERMAYLLGEPVGKTVGYRVRFETKVSADTRIEVLTEGILTRMLVGDATLDGVVAVIFDEFHERSIHSDLALALCRQSQLLVRDDLRIIIMSATIDATHICRQLQAPLIESEGRMFPVTVYHSEEDINLREVARTVSIAVLKAYREHEGDILVFLPGQREIEQCQEILLSSSIPHVYPLYGNLAPEKQRQAIQPSSEGERKVVLATPIAETSLTIEGVRIVVDSGLCRSLVFDARTGLSHLETVRISMDMATQRMGRAGRVAEGVCYRLWTIATEHQMGEQRKPELMEADLASMVLDIYAFGESNIASLPWLDLPPVGNVAKAEQLLVSLGALRVGKGQANIDSLGIASSAIGSMVITSLGRKMAQLPCHPRIARMILGAKDSEQKSLACDIAAILEEKDPMSDSEDSDLSMRLSVLRSARRKKSLGRWSRIAMIAKEYQRMARITEDNGEVDAEDVGMLVALAYPERIGKAMDNIGNFQLASGEVVRIDAADSMYAYQWIAIASMNSKVFLAAPLCVEELVEQEMSLASSGIVAEQDHVAWDGKQGCVVMQREQRIGKLIVSSKPIHDADAQEIVRIVCEAVRKNGLSMFDWNEQVQRLQRRVAQVALWHPELGIPDLSTEHLMNTAIEWLPFYLEQQGKVKSSIAELKKLNLHEILWALIPYELQQEIDRLAPEHIQVPTGSRIRVDYRQGAEAPVLSVRLQECFGLQDTPCVNDGKQPVLMELLSPGFKPVQLTQDLGSFWQSTYFEVRKELKRRYPKHSWPENPLEAEAVRGVKRK